MSVAVQQITTDAQSTASTTHTVTKPSGTVAGDVLWLQINTADDIPTPPTGWTEQGRIPSGTTVQGGVGGSKLILYSRVCDGTEPSTWTFTKSSSVKSGSICARLSGVNTSIPVDVTPTTNSGTGTTATATGLTTVSDGDLVIMGCAIAADTGATAGQFTGGTTVGASVVGDYNRLDYLNKSPAGAVGSSTSTLSSSVAWEAYQVAVKAAVPADAATVTLSLTPASGGAYANAILATPGLVGYWRLGESSGTSAVDLVKGNNGTYTGGFTLAQPGALEGDANTAVGFNGSTGYINVPNNTNMNLGDVLSIEAWIMRGPNIGTGRTIMSKQANGYVLWVSGDTLILRKSGVADIVTATSQSKILDSTRWHHVVATKNGATDGRVYIDGVDVTFSFVNQTIVDNTSALQIGQSGGQFWDGLLDEIAIYNTVLTPAQVLQHYNLGRPEIQQAVDTGSVRLGLTPSGSDTYVPSAGTQYSDAATATVALTPSTVEAGAFVEASIASLTMTPTVIELLASTDALTSVVTFTPSTSDVSVFTDASAPNLGLSPNAAAAEALASVDSLTAPVVFTPSGVDVRGLSEAATVNVSLTGSGVDVAASLDALTSVVVLSPSAADVGASIDSNTAAVVFSFSAVEGKAAFTEASTIPVTLLPQGAAVLASVDARTVNVVFTPTPSVEAVRFIDAAVGLLLFTVVGVEVQWAKHIQAIIRWQGNGNRFTSVGTSRLSSSPVGVLRVKSASGRYRARNQ